MPDQNQIIYLMFLNGVLFLGLNFIAYSLTHPGGRGSKRLGYVLIVAALLAWDVTQEFKSLLEMGFDASKIRNIVVGGFVIPVFFTSLVYYRIQKNRMKKNIKNPTQNSGD